MSTSRLSSVPSRITGTIEFDEATSACSLRQFLALLLPQSTIPNTPSRFPHTHTWNYRLHTTIHVAADLHSLQDELDLEYELIR